MKKKDEDGENVDTAVVAELDPVRLGGRGGRGIERALGRVLRGRWGEDLGAERGEERGKQERVLRRREEKGNEGEGGGVKRMMELGGGVSQLVGMRVEGLEGKGVVLRLGGRLYPRSD